MKTLSVLLKEFNGRGMDEKQLACEFEKIARSAIYGGHFRVNDDFDIYIREIEFYFHSENESESSIHDWAMYHRGTNVDYFPVGSLHPHRSGIDVTFERRGSYRASYDESMIVLKSARINVRAYDGDGNPLVDEQGNKQYDLRLWRFSKTE